MLYILLVCWSIFFVLIGVVPEFIKNYSLKLDVVGYLDHKILKEVLGQVAPPAVKPMNTSSNELFAHRSLARRNVPITTNNAARSALKAKLFPATLEKATVTPAGENAFAPTDQVASNVMVPQTSFNVYFCKHNVNHGVRFFYLVRESVLLHPSIVLVDSPQAAEYIIYLPGSSNWATSECGVPALMSKTIVLDEGDGSHLFHPPQHVLKEIYKVNADYERRKVWSLAYFKRSAVHRKDGLFKGYENYFKAHDNIFPMTYTIMESYVKPMFTTLDDRDYDLVCTLRGSKEDPTRKRIKEWIQEYSQSRQLKKYIAGEVNHASRTVISAGYFGSMHRAKIIVTSNPSHWEGDFRFMEAMGSGALVFIDKMAVPRPNPLIDHQHVVYYDAHNKTDLFERLDFYRANTKQSRRVAVAGYIFAMTHHRAANLADYILRTVEVQKAMKVAGLDVSTATSNETAALLPYTYTGYDMRRYIATHQKGPKNLRGS